jgi:hypothetical protein
MQKRGIERRDLVLLEPSNEVMRRRTGIERLELVGNRVEVVQCGAVVVFVVALDETWRHSIECPWAAKQGGDGEPHIVTP